MSGWTRGTMHECAYHGQHLTYTLSTSIRFLSVVFQTQNTYWVFDILSE